MNDINLAEDQFLPAIYTMPEEVQPWAKSWAFAILAVWPWLVEPEPYAAFTGDRCIEIGVYYGTKDDRKRVIVRPGQCHALVVSGAWHGGNEVRRGDVCQWHLPELMEFARLPHQEPESV